MAEAGDYEMAEVFGMLEAEPSSMPDAGIVGALTQPGPDIPAMREQLAILVSTGKAKEAIGKQLTHDEVKRLTEKEVQKFCKRYETYVGAKTTETFVDSFLSLLTRGASLLAPIKDVEALRQDLKKDYLIDKKLSTLVGSLALRFGPILMAVNAALITAKHIDFDSLRKTKKKEAPVVDEPAPE